MFAGVADTHAAIWLLFGDSRLSVAAKSQFDLAAEEKRKIALAPISIAAVLYLVDKGRLPPEAFDELLTALGDTNHVLCEAPFDRRVVAAMRQVPRDAVPDMPDRIVAATAVYLGVPLISRDRRIQASTLETIWQGFSANGWRPQLALLRAARARGVTSHSARCPHGGLLPHHLRSAKFGFQIADQQFRAAGTPSRRACLIISRRGDQIDWRGSARFRR